MSAGTSARALVRMTRFVSLGSLIARAVTLAK